MKIIGQKRQKNNIFMEILRIYERKNLRYTNGIKINDTFFINVVFEKDIISFYVLCTF